MSNDQKLACLWQLLDDIDTLSDSMKPEKTPYYNAVMRLVQKRKEVAYSPDGYKIVLTSDPNHVVADWLA